MVRPGAQERVRASCFWGYLGPAETASVLVERLRATRDGTLEGSSCGLKSKQPCPRVAFCSRLGTLTASVVPAQASCRRAPALAACQDSFLMAACRFSLGISALSQLPHLKGAVM